MLDLTKTYKLRSSPELGLELVGPIRYRQDAVGAYVLEAEVNRIPVHSSDSEPWWEQWTGDGDYYTANSNPHPMDLVEVPVEEHRQKLVLDPAKTYRLKGTHRIRLVNPIQIAPPDREGAYSPCPITALIEYPEGEEPPFWGLWSEDGTYGYRTFPPTDSLDLVEVEPPERA